MPEPRWRDVDAKGNCSHCAGLHFGTGAECPYREENMGEPCAVCGERTSYCCSDCAIDGAGKVYVCVTESCRTEHEKKHARSTLIKYQKAEPYVRELWQNLLDKDDRNSPAEYPEMCLITFEEFAGYLEAATANEIGLLRERNAALEALSSQLNQALTSLCNTLVAHDEDGLTEHAEPMIAARRALSGYTNANQNDRKLARENGRKFINAFFK